MTFTETSVDSYSDLLNKAADRHQSFHDLKQLYDSAGVTESYVRTVVASNPAVPQSVLSAWSTISDVATRIGVARNSNTLDYVLAHMAKDRFAHVQYEVASNMHTPKHVLVEMSRSKDAFVLSGLASNIATPARTLEFLSGKRDSNVRLSVAGNRAAPAHVLEKLAKDKDFEVRALVAGNRNTPKQCLIDLFATSHPAFTRRLMHNPSTPSWIVQFLADEASTKA